MILAAVMRHLFPDANPLADYTLRDDSDGRGPYIDPKTWRLMDDMPTREELAEAWAAIAPKLVWDQVRLQRAPLLAAADLAILKAEDTGGDLAPLRAYRQALRDLTKGPDPAAVTWPTLPS